MGLHPTGIGQRPVESSLDPVTARVPAVDNALTVGLNTR